MAHLDLAKKRSKFKRKAVIVGIDKYVLGEGASLQGCKNDARDMGNTLLVCGFPPTRIRYLTDERATKAKIVKSLEWLVQDAKPGDVLVYYHSGHGSQKTDVSGDEETADKLDEMVIPHDFSWNDESTHLTDDDLYEFFTKKCPKGTRGEVIIDTCHSGTGTRSLFDRKYDNQRARYLVPPLEYRQILNTRIPSRTTSKYFGFSNVKQKVGDAKSTKDVMIGLQHNATWSACQAHQVAWELSINGVTRGAFTYNFCEIMRKREGNITRQTLYELLRSKMANDGYEQIPDLEVGSEEALEQFAFRRNFEDDATELGAEPQIEPLPPSAAAAGGND